MSTQSTTPPEATVLPIIAAIAFCHMLNDLMQSLIPAIYPVLKGQLGLSFGQIGLVTFVFQGTASILQPIVGLITDRRPLPYSLPFGMGLTLIGLVMLAHAATFAMVLVSVAFVGMGSSVFHPESSRIARLAAGRRPGFAQSFFQVGGNAGSSLGPLLAAFIVVPFGQISVEWFAGVALVGIGVLWAISRWYASEGQTRLRAAKVRAAGTVFGRRIVAFAIMVLIALSFSKFVFLVHIAAIIRSI